LPPKLAAIFEKHLSRSLRIAKQTQELRSATAKANAQFRREQARLLDALAGQLGLSSILKELAELRKRHVALVRGAMEKTQIAIAREQRVSGNLRKRSRN
jgi:hypothetical protein